MTPLSLITLFHLNFAFSSIEIERRPLVLEQCYWPLLKLAGDLQLPLGIELTGYTLEAAAKLDPCWVDELRQLITEGKCELIGSGYAQIIGPIVPAEVNAANLYWGNQIYEDILGVRPQLALINEQAYSASLVTHYLQAGYQGIIMEWNNPARYHQEWDYHWRYYPQYACSQTGDKIPVIWNNSTAFQKFQQYVYADLDRDEYVEQFLARHQNQSDRVLMLYGNDAEIFNFRPGRYLGEAKIKEDEWQKIYDLMRGLQEDDRFQFVPLSSTLDYLESDWGGNALSLESPEDPIPVKKQRKYNVTRWAVTGTDLEINSQCWAIYNHLKQNLRLEEWEWRELCYLWSSDFRTHITPKRFTEYQERINKFSTQLQVATTIENLTIANSRATIPPGVEVKKKGKFLILNGANVKLRLNCDRGLAIDRLWFKHISPDWLCGSLSHGYYDDIDWLADYFSGHLVFQPPGRNSIEDTYPIVPQLYYDRDRQIVWANSQINTPLGPLVKQVGLAINSPQIHIEYQLHWPANLVGYLRLGYVMVNPEAFEAESLYFATHNGGEQLEHFSLESKAFDHHSPVSSTVSSRCGLGMTEGIVILGDRHQQLQISIDKSQCALLGMVTCQPVASSYFLRLAFSARELDETAKPNLFEMVEPGQTISVYRLSITARSTSAPLS
ncbi:hypothetical protein [Roseofilum casamattae]|uniref:Glycoside hydrolase family 57 N-terminal domain-containing protein n=1 Tax=Roseofilum casamattae BLCC-M143 TaxID=3022442 RepID=A0ABT7BV04_9CYAN|nr:hypothetical protein [Roseofilum casamattae]MDJ1183015.1 hypothetical protein [Roseofilum casamattae BLCC-M143]